MGSNKVIAIVPARGGSKGVPKKNIKNLGGYPLLAYSIIASKLCPEIERVIVSTDSPEIAEIAKFYGGEVPFLRPSQYANDKSPNEDFIIHALDYFKNEEGFEPEIIVQILPTTPFRDPKLISMAISEFYTDSNATSLRAVHALPEPPQKMLQMQDGYLVGFFPNDPRPDYHNLPRQTFPTAYQPNGYVDILKTDFVRKTGALFGPRMKGFITEFVVEVDAQEQFEHLEYILEKKGHMLYDYMKKNYPVINND